MKPITDIVLTFTKLISTSAATILDFEAGKGAERTLKLRDAGFNCTAYETGENFVKGLHSKSALKKKYDTVMLSNVLNTKDSIEEVAKVLISIKSVMLPKAMLILNLPDLPLGKAWSDLKPWAERYIRLQTIITEIFGADSSVLLRQEKGILMVVTKL